MAWQGSQQEIQRRERRRLTQVLYAYVGALQIHIKQESVSNPRVFPRCKSNDSVLKALPALFHSLGPEGTFQGEPIDQFLPELEVRFLKIQGPAKKPNLHSNFSKGISKEKIHAVDGNHTHAT